MNKNVIMPSAKNPEIVVEIVEFLLEKNTMITVPSNYIAIVFIDNSPIRRIDECNKESVFKLLEKNKDYLGEKLKVSFITSKKISNVIWGFGDVTISDVNDDVYKFGLNGELKLLIVDKAAFMNSFGVIGNISIDDIGDKIRPIIKDVGVSIVTNYVKENNIAIPDLDSKYQFLKKSFIDLMNKNLNLNSCGLKVEDISINPGPKTLIRSSNDSNIDIDKLQQTIVDTIHEQSKIIKEDLEKSISPKLTTDFLIDKAVTDEDLATPASAIYSNIEKNINDCNEWVRFGDKLCITKEEFDDISNDIVSQGESIAFLNKFLNLDREHELNGIIYVEVPTEFKFMIFGCSASDSMKAARDWTVLNKIRHMSEENGYKLEKILEERKITKKEFLKNALALYRRIGVYTKD